MGLIERDAEFAALTAHWARARGGRGGLVLVTAESGGGKTALINEFVRSLMGQAPVLWGACDSLATPRPLGPLLDMREALGRNVQSLLEGHGQAHEIYVAVFEELLASPCVLVVDDLHWADQGTVDLLRFLLRRLSTTRSLVVGSLRLDEIDPSNRVRALLGDVARSPDAITLDLPPLSSSAVKTLVADRLIDPSRLHSLTGGNPFFVEQMLEHNGGELPSTVRDAILARTAGLEADARDLLDLLVCAPEAIPDRLLPQLGFGVEPLRSLHQVGLIRRSQGGVAFRHDLYRMAIADSLPPGGEAALHRRMLDALEAGASADPAVMVHHARGANDPERILQYASAAGVTAARAGAHTQAAEFFTLALDHAMSATPSARAELLERLATEEYLLDRLDNAISACKRAIRLREQAGDLGGMSTNYQSLSVYEWYNADREAAERYASDAVTVLGVDANGEVLGHAVALQAYLAIQASDLGQAAVLLERARKVATEVDDPTLNVRIELLEAILGVFESTEGAREAVIGIVGPGQDSFDDTLSSGYSNLAYLDVEYRRLPEAVDVMKVSLPLTVEWDMPICYVWQMGARGRMQMMKGDWQAAEADAETVLAAPSAPLARTWPHLVRGLVRMRRGDAAEADLDDAWSLAQQLNEPLRLMPAAAALVERSWLTGIRDDRVDEATMMLRQLDVVGLEWARGDLAVWLQRLIPELDLHDLEVSEAHQLHLAGQYLAAADAWAGLGSSYEQSLALVESADEEAVRQGLGLLDRLGADAVAAKLRQDLRDRGVSNVPAKSRGVTLNNAAGLTAREVEVLGLLGEGLSNAELAARLYISPKTADHHVSAILSKLRVANRRQAAEAGRELGIVS
ncbi:MAG TPA: AAA family ATPase [Actinomycetes bacterium]|nr:AAA family ATPase [Actinomycetes bacterium]